MKLKTLAALLVPSLITISSGAFASGYGPAPFYRPDVGASASQRGQSAQTLAAERAASQSGVKAAVPNDATVDAGTNLTASN
ncbi:hypothetical protein H3V53_03635 [Paraburkholderia bengalensis]|uniref:DUF4148 domain-containing protein n=1 Tax=Paraburkholderia bengalensis TaxID=2747562 RepID=A0ABU8ILF2_9BURK